MAFDVSHLPASVAAPLRTFYRRKRFYGLLRIVALAATVWLAAALIGTHVDRLWLLSDGARQVLALAVHGVAALVALIGLGLWATRRPTVSSIAYEMERELPRGEIEERFVTLNSLAKATKAEGSDPESNVHAVLMAKLVSGTEQVSAGVRAGGLVRDGLLKRLVAVLVVALAVHGALLLPAAYQYRLMLQRLVQPGANLPRPSFVQITVQPETIVVGLGGEAVIQAEISGHIPAGLDWLMAKLGTATADCQILTAVGTPATLAWDPAKAEDMTRIQRSLYLYTRGELAESFAFRIRYGDALTAVHTVRVVPQPQVTRLALTVTPPEYTGLPEETLEADGKGTLQFLPGTAITVHFAVDQPVAEPVFLRDKQGLSEDDEGLTWNAETRQGTYEFVLQRPTALEVKVTNAEGFANVEKATLAIGVREDQAPSVRLESPSADVESVPGELLPLVASFEDDLGITEAAIRYQLNPQINPDAPFQEMVIDLGEAPGKSVSVNPSFDLDGTGAAPGDEVLLMLRVRDTAGNDGQSRPVTVRVVAFTRGENERQRLAALRFFGEALALVAAETLPEAGAGDAPAKADGAPPSAAGEGGASGGDYSVLAVAPETWTAITKLAEAGGYQIGEAPSFSGLLAFLEREHHFTDLPRHKAAVRELYGKVNAAALGVEASGPSDRAGRNVVLGRLAGEVVPTMVAQRAPRNLIWRLYGLLDEAETIRVRLLDLEIAEAAADAAKEAGKPDAKADAAISDTKRAMKRRATLYLDTLQDLGDELISLTKRWVPADEQAVLATQGELNTAAYYLTRGSTSKRLESVAEVAKQLDALLVIVHGAAWQALERPALAKGDRKAKPSIPAQLSAGQLGPGGATAATAWLTADDRLLGRNPFATHHAVLLRRILLHALAAADPAAALLALPTEVRALATGGTDGPGIGRVVLDEDRIAALLALQWEAQRLRDQPMSDRERDEVEAYLQALGETATEDDRQRLARLVSNDASLAALAAAALPQTAPDAVITELLALLDTTQPAIDDLAASTAAAAEIGPVIAAAHTAADRVGRRLDAVIADLAYRQSYGATPGASDTVATEVLLLKLRAAGLRYALMSGGSLQVLGDAAGRSLDAGSLAGVLGELPRLTVARNALRANLQSALSAWGDGSLDSPASRQTFPVLALYDASRTQVNTATRLVAGESAEPLIAGYLVALPEAGGEYIASRAADLQTAREALQRAGDSLGQEPPDFVAYAAELARSSAALGRLRTAADRAGDGEGPVAVREALAALENRVARLALPVDAANQAAPALDPAAVRRNQFAIGELKPEFERVDRLVRQDSGSADTEGFRGGPDGIWEDATRHAADESRRRLLGQLQTFSRQATLGILGAGAAPRDATTAPYDRSLAWALLRYRTVRGDLSGPVRSQPRRDATRGGSDRLLDWLMAELDESRKEANKPDALRDYPKVTREYLDSMKDFLRY